MEFPIRTGIESVDAHGYTRTVIRRPKSEPQWRRRLHFAKRMIDERPSPNLILIFQCGPASQPPNIARCSPEGSRSEAHPNAAGKAGALTAPIPSRSANSSTDLLAGLLRFG